MISYIVIAHIFRYVYYKSRMYVLAFYYPQLIIRRKGQKIKTVIVKMLIIYLA